MNAIALLSTRQVADLAGVTFRMLDWWDREGIMPASVPADGSGSRRQYTLADVRLIQVVKLLRELGAVLAVAATAVEELRELTDPEWGCVVGVDLYGSLLYRGEVLPAAYYGLDLMQLGAEPLFVATATIPAS